MHNINQKHLFTHQSRPTHWWRVLEYAQSSMLVCRVNSSSQLKHKYSASVRHINSQFNVSRYSINTLCYSTPICGHTTSKWRLPQKQLFNEEIRDLQWNFERLEIRLPDSHGWSRTGGRGHWFSAQWCITQLFRSMLANWKHGDTLNPSSSKTRDGFWSGEHQISSWS
jgi:hypothetical protein